MKKEFGRDFSRLVLSIGNRGGESVNEFAARAVTVIARGMECAGVTLVVTGARGGAKGDMWMVRSEGCEETGEVVEVREWLAGDREMRMRLYGSDGKKETVEYARMVLNIVAGEVSRMEQKMLMVDYGERTKELWGINTTSEIIDREAGVKETLQQIAEALPEALQEPEVACAKIVYEGVAYRSRAFKDTEWRVREPFMTIDNRKGYVQLNYKKAMAERYEGPFLKEEVRMLRNVARLVCGYLNQWKGREALDNGHETVKKKEEVYRSPFSKDVQPLQEFFNKQLSAKYIYLDMMKHKVKNILFVSTLYDSFILESEDRFFEQFMGGEIYQFSLFSMPRTTAVTNEAQAMEMLRKQKFDLVILMVGIDKKQPWELSQAIKRRYKKLPIYLLANRKDDIEPLMKAVPESGTIDKAWVWNGESKILFSIVKSIEDRANAENDTAVGLVRVILLVEDNPVYYSLFMQQLHSVVFGQIDHTLKEMTDRDNEIERVSRMRSRPKILHAQNYEEAEYLLTKYKDFLLCVITDLEFERNGVSDRMAGARFIEEVRRQIVGVPMLLESSDDRAKEVAEQLGVGFLSKNSETLEADLRAFVSEQLGFGNFVFRDPKTGKEIAEAKSLKDFENIIKYMPAKTIKMHSDENQFSLWLMSRGEIELAKRVNPLRYSDYADANDYKQNLLKLFDAYNEERTRGKILDFDQVNELTERNIVSMSTGSFGGKGRGLAFINLLIYNTDFGDLAKDIHIRMPRTAIIGTDEYDLFMKEIGDRERLQKMTYEELRKLYVETKLSERLRQKLTRFLGMCTGPLSVRSSSLSEDSLSQPFAGVFDTYVVPNNGDLKERLQTLVTAIKLVYASIYSPESRNYFEAIERGVEQEKMGIVLQELVGSEHEGYFYPHFCGTSQSYNYYPVAHQKPEEGFANMAVGLGYYVVGGQKSFRFSPKYPNIDIFATKDMLKSTQTDFLALDLKKEGADYLKDGEQACVARLPISVAEKHGTLKHCASVYNPQNDTITPGLDEYGPRVVDFADILKYGYMPLAELLERLLSEGQEAMGCPVEIEWAVNLDKDEQGRPSFYLVQIKPMAGGKALEEVELSKVSRSRMVLQTTNSLGNGVIEDIEDIVYVKAEKFDRLKTLQMVKEVDYLNDELSAAKRPYILIGPGRWGTRDQFLGIPVTWPQISGAKVIVEMSLPGFPLDSSLGSHFFHNVTSMGIGYFAVQSENNEDYINWQWIEKQKAEHETEFFRHVRLQRPLRVRMNGRLRKAQVLI